MGTPTTAHPYIPNSVPQIKQSMLDALGVGDVADLFEQIPPSHRLQRPLQLPVAIQSEAELQRHLLGLIKKNVSCEDNLSFLGAGCWQHYVPAICDEIVSRSEFLTSIWGTPSSDHGRNQALFEFCSLLGELLDMDCVGQPVYSWGCAAGNALRMAARITGRRTVLVAGSLDPERRSVISNFCEERGAGRHLTLVEIATDPASGLVDLQDLGAQLSSDVAAFYFETPSFLGVLESQGAEIAALVHRVGAKLVVGVDPITLGVVAPPSSYGADLVVGTIQPLGLHLDCGGSMGGFIASPDEEQYVYEFPTLLITTAPTVKGELGFTTTLLEQSSYDAREDGKDWTGHTVNLWAIASAAYMTLMGPDGFRDIGELILVRSHYAARRIATIPGLRVLYPSGFFKEFVVNFDGTGLDVETVNRALLTHNIFGGKDLTSDFPELGGSALYCVTEIHTVSDIDRLVDALIEVTSK